jgi:hypothetical protein
MKKTDWRWDFSAIPSRGREAIGFGLLILPARFAATDFHVVLRRNRTRL